MNYRTTWGIRALFLLALTVISWGCGGGSGGTGTRSFEGDVRSTDGAAIAGAKVTIVETGDSAVTNSSGHFLFESDAEGDEIILLIESGLLSTELSVDLSQSSSDAVNLSIEINLQTGVGVVSGVDVRVKIGGVCDRYFENNRVIRQSNRVPKGQRCPLSISLRASRGGLPHRSFKLEKLSCADLGSDKWTTILTSETDDTGKAEVEFQYFDDINHCLYRVVVPLNDNEISPIEYLIVSGTKQNLG